MIPALLLVCLPAPLDAPAPTAEERIQVMPAPCATSTVVRMTWAAERRWDVRTTQDGALVASHTTHDERHLDRAVEVLACREGVAQRIRVRYGEAFERRLDTAPGAAGVEQEPGAPTYTTERSALAGRNFDIVQAGESANVLLDGRSPAPAALARLVLEAESVEGGAVPLPGDDVARALGAVARTKGVPFAFDPLVARELLAGDESADCAATFTFLGIERLQDGGPRARFEARILVRESPEGGLVRDADLRGTLYADPHTGRPLEFEVQGHERQKGAASGAGHGAELESTGTWRVRRTWRWR